MAFSSSSLKNGFFSAIDADKVQRIKEAKIEQDLLYDKLEVEGQILDTWERAIAETDRVLEIVKTIPVNAHQQSVVQSLKALQRHHMNMFEVAEIRVKKLCDKIEIVNKIFNEE